MKATHDPIPDYSERVTIPDKMEQLKALAQPLVNYLREHYDPHCQVIVNMDFVKVTRDEMGVPLDEDGITREEAVAEYINNTLEYFQTL